MVRYPLSLLAGWLRKVRQLAPAALALGMIFAGLALQTDDKADAAAVATTTSSSSNTDKVRCNFTYETDSSPFRIRGRCYFTHYSTQVLAQAGTDINPSDANWTNATPPYRFMPSAGSGCSFPPSAKHVAVGPQTAAQSLSGLASIPVQAFEFDYEVTGANCTNGTTVDGWGYALPRRFGENAAYSFALQQTGQTLTNVVSRGDSLGTFSGGAWTVSAGATTSATTQAVGAWPAWPTDWYPRSATSVCSAVTVSLPAGVSASDVLGRGDTITVTASVASGSLPLLYAKFPGVNFQPGAIVWPNDGTRWAGYRILPQAAGLSTTFVVGNYMTSGTFMVGDVSIGCQIDNGSGPEYDTRVLGDGWSGVAAPVLRDCARVFTSWAPFDETTGSVDITVSPSMAGANGIPAGTAYSFSVGVSARYAEQGQTPTAWSNWQSAGPIGRGTNGLSVSYTVTFPTDTGWGTSLNELELRCQDAEGIYRGKYFTTYDQLGLGDEASPHVDSESCYGAVGIGWSPSSWVPGLVRLASCIAQSMFIPSDSSITKLYAAGEQLTTKAPISFVTTAYTTVSGAFTGAGDAVVDHEDDCFQLMGDGPSVEGEQIWTEQTACGVDITSTELTTARSWIGIAFWISFALGLLMKTRRIIAGG